MLLASQIDRLWMPDNLLAGVGSVVSHDVASTIVPLLPFMLDGKRADLPDTRNGSSRVSDVRDGFLRDPFDFLSAAGDSGK
jgi:hypothetical protein